MEMGEPFAGAALSCNEIESAPEFRCIEMSEPLAMAVPGSKSVEVELEFPDEPYEGWLPLHWLRPISAFSDSRVWSSLAVVIFLHTALACAVWYAPQPQVQSDKYMEVRLVSMQGAPDGAGSGMEASAKAETEEGATESEMSAVPEPRREAPPETPVPQKSEILPAEPKVETQPHAPAKKHTLPAPVPAKEKKLLARVHSVSSDSPVHSDTVSEGTGQPAGSGTGAESSPGPGIPSGRGAGLAASGPVERSFGSPDGPSFLHRVMPSYPILAKRLEKQGTVLLRVTIDESGRPAQVEILQKAGFGLDEEAVKAVKESTFVPAKREGKPLTCKALLPIRFVLTES